MQQSNAPKRVARGAATTFRTDEVDLAVQLFAELLRGGDPVVFLRQEPFRTLHAKFLRMRRKLSGTEGA